MRSAAHASLRRPNRSVPVAREVHLIRLHLAAMLKQLITCSCHVLVDASRDVHFGGTRTPVFGITVS